MGKRIKLPSASAIAKADRDELIEHMETCEAVKRDWFRKQILDNRRIDILASEVLGLTVQPFHLAMMRFQFLHPETLQLVFRGAGKTTTCTVTRAIWLLLRNPNLRILIAGKTIAHAKGILREIKAHFESNEKLRSIFGAYYDPRKVTKWDETEIEVLPRTIRAKESSITCIGTGGQVVGKHYDAILSDDLVDEENSRTKLQRDKIKTWYYQSLTPTLEPPDEKVPHRGEHHHLGTRYHYADIWGHLIGNELAACHQIIPALDEQGRSPWPEKFPPKFFLEKKRRAGTIIFNAQYQNDTEAMKGEIFQYDDCQQLASEDWPDPRTLDIFMGVDLAISEKDSADKFAIVVIGMRKDRTYFVLDFFEGQLRFAAQTAKILDFAERWDPVRIAIETNQYQEAQYQALKDEEKAGNELRLKPMKTDRDKITRAHKLSAIFEDKRFFFRKGEHDILIEHLVLFPSFRYKDLFDALDMAVAATKRKRRRRRRGKEPGVI